MIRPFVKRAWRVGRRYYGIWLAVSLALTAILVVIFGLILYTVSPEALREEASTLGVPLEVAYTNFKAMVALLFSILMGLSASTVAAMVAGGSIQADIRNGVYELLFGNGVSPGQVAKALLATSLSAAAALCLFTAAALAIVITAVAPEAYVILPTLVLAPLACLVSGAVLIVAVGLAKPNTFKIATGIGATKNLAYTIATAPGVALTFILVPFMATMDLSTATFVTSLISAAVIAASVGLIFLTPRLVNTEELVTQAE
ncbi:MAG: hypothetical protein ABWK05_06665 [Pyrobaculum sp.]